MKKIILLPLFAMLSLGAKAQVDSTSLYQNFNLCDSNAAGEHFPPGWTAYSVIGLQVWQCYVKYGVNNTPCLQMNGYSGGNYQDENWLFTPMMKLSSYASIYLNFAAEYAFAGDSLHVFVSNNYTIGSNPHTSGTWTELGHYGIMLTDSSYNGDVFREFQVDLTDFKATPCIVAFKYTSTDTTGSRWDIDSVVTSTVPLGPIPHTGIVNIIKEKLPLQVIGFSSSSEIKAAFNGYQGQYTLAIYDLVGRKVYGQNVVANGGPQVLEINDANLVSGMYIMKLNNETMYGATKFVVQ